MLTAPAGANWSDVGPSRDQLPTFAAEKSRTSFEPRLSGYNQVRGVFRALDTSKQGSRHPMRNMQSNLDVHVCLYSRKLTLCGRWAYSVHADRTIRGGGIRYVRLGLVSLPPPTLIQQTHLGHAVSITSVCLLQFSFVLLHAWAQVAYSWCGRRWARPRPSMGMH